VVSGGVRCWGYNDDGQLGDETTDDTSTPVEVTVNGSPLTGVTAVSASEEHTCAVVSGGVRCWGDNYTGQLGDGTTDGSSTPVEVTVNGSPLTGVTAVSAGRWHSCALVTGEAKCWGENWRGELGDGTSGHALTPVELIAVSSGSTAVTSGANYICAVVSGGVKCWGDNYYGQLGDGTTTDSSSPVEVTVSGSPLTGVNDVTAGAYHTCALVSDRVKCWGYNGYGQLGDETTTWSLEPVEVKINGSPLTGVTAISAGANHTCALVSSGVKCWGQNYLGQLGDGTTNYSSTPVDVLVEVNPDTPLTGVTDVSAGNEHTCAVVPGGVKCWGYNFYGQLAEGTYTDRTTAVDVLVAANTPLAGVSAISSGGWHTCALVSGGLKCWGNNDYGQLGAESIMGSPRPVDVLATESTLLAGVSDVSSGDDHTCALVSGGLKCWGENQNGGLGDGTFQHRFRPVDAITVDVGVSAVSAGDSLTCAVVSGGVKCWGNNWYGQMGFEGRAFTPRDAVVFRTAAVVVRDSNMDSMRVTEISGIGLSRVIFGSLLQNVTSATVNGIAVLVSNASFGSVKISIPKLAPGIYDIVLSGGNGKLTWVGGLTIKPGVAKKKLITGFAGGSAVLTSTQKGAIKAFVSRATALVCVGGVYSSKTSETDRKLAIARAKVVCRYAKQISPALVTTVSSSFKSKPSVSGRMVKLTARK